MTDPVALSNARADAHPRFMPPDSRPAFPHRAERSRKRLSDAIYAAHVAAAKQERERAAWDQQNTCDQFE